MTVLHEEVDAGFLKLDGVGRVVSDALRDLHVFDAATLPVTITELSSVRFLMVSKSCSGTAALGTMPWMVPEPSRKMGKSNLPDARRL
jgi:hypothetical protein